MALGWQELILIFAVLLLVFGPSKLPEIARELGKAVNEFKKASSGLAEAVESPPEAGSREDSIRDVARRLNIETRGKTVEQITEDIVAKAKGEETPADKTEEG